MRLSARNQLNATIGSVQLGEVMATVNVTLPDGQRLTAAITRDAAEELGLASGDQVMVIIQVNRGDDRQARLTRRPNATKGA